MKFKFDRTTFFRLVCLLILIAAMSMGAIELVFLVDLGGIDFAVAFLLVYFAAIRDTLIYKYQVLKSGIGEFFVYLSGLYIFQPKVFVSHALASGVLVALTCSVFLGCLLWVPPIYISSGFIS